MKPNLYFVLICIIILNFPKAFAVTITLKVDKKCKPTVIIEGKEVKVEFYKLTIEQGKAIKFKLQNESGHSVKLNISESENKILNLTDIDFDTINPIKTDEKLILKVGEKSIFLDDEFDLQFGCNLREAQNISIKFVVNSIKNQEISDNRLVTAQKDINNYQFKNSVEPNQIASGSMVLDALALSQPKDLLYNDFLKIMRLYFGNDLKNTHPEILSKIAPNKFLSDEISKDYLKALKVEKESRAETDLVNNISSLSLSSIGGLDVTNIADGLAKFLVKRTKEELSTAFFDKFKKVLDDPKYVDLKTLFPQTYVILSSIGDNIYDYEKYIQNLREAFKKDIQTLNENLPGIIPNHQDFFTQHPPLEASLKSGCYITGELQKQTHPGDILANYPIEYLDSVSKNWSGAIQTLQLLSESLRDISSSDSTYWVNIKYVRQLVNDKVAFRIYLGLVYQKAITDYNSIPFENNITFIQLLDKLANNITYYDSYKKYILGFCEKTNALNNIIKSYSKPANDSLAIELYAKYFKSSLDMLEYCTRVGELPYLSKTSGLISHLHDTLKVYFDVSNSLADLATDINRKNYSAAINEVLEVYNLIIKKPKIDEPNIIPEEYSKLNKKDFKNKNNELRTFITNNKSKFSSHDFNALSSAASDTNFCNWKKAIQSIGDEKTKITEISNKLAFYGAFISAVATAKTSDEVSAAIEAAALPSGSSRIKRESAFNVSLNAFVGLYGGGERISGLDNPIAFSYGVTAPVGVSISRGHSVLFLGTGKKGWKEGHCGWSTSLMLSVVDIGALASFRFKSDNDSISQVPKIELRDILSPGAFISIGFPKSPVSVNFGAQVGPNLRKVGSEVNDYSNKLYWRLSGSICVDIPVVNLYTKPKMK